MDKQLLMSELISLVEKVKARITDDSDMVWTHYMHPSELRAELDAYISDFKQGHIQYLKRLHALFLPTATLQEHSLSNNWAEEYISLSAQFDSLYAVL
jgi:hypothetical protein